MDVEELSLKVAIRAEGGSNIGMGHIMRTLVLAKELSLNNEVFYICRNISENKSGIIEIEKNGFYVYYFEENILELLANVDVDILITDSYNVNEDYFTGIRKLVKYTIYIDDINSFDYPVDLIINQNINAEDFNYCQKYKLLGLRYLMLREEFRSIPKKFIKKQVSDIMITMGGADTVGFTKTIVNWIKNLNFNFHVIIGSSFKDIEYFRNVNFDNIKFYFDTKMIEVMQKCDLAVSASGSSIYELIASGVPSLNIVIADNQTNISKKLSDLNIVYNLGWYYNLKKDKFEDSLIKLCSNYDLRKHRSIEGQKLVDGLGGKRIADFIEKNFQNQ